MKSPIQSPEYFQLMAEYNRWQNQKVYAACARLSDEDRKKDLGAFFKSLHGTLNHLLLADHIWMGRFLERPYDFKSLDQELYADFSNLTNSREAMDREILNWVATLNEEKLGSLLTYQSKMAKQPKTLPFWLCAVHMFNHQTHHRGQATTLLFQLGQDVGITDLPFTPGWDL